MEADQWSFECVRCWCRCAESIIVTCEKSRQRWVVGTGGTVAGVGRYLKSMNENVIVAISDPDGSGLYNKVLAQNKLFEDLDLHLDRSSMEFSLIARKAKEPRDDTK